MRWKRCVQTHLFIVEDKTLYAECMTEYSDKAFDE